MFGSMKSQVISVLSLVAAIAWPVGGGVMARQGPPTFRGGVNLVSLNVVVKDSRGRPIRDLAGGDFEVLDQGRTTKITDFRVDDDPISVAVLLDTSGSMSLGTRLESARRAAETVFAQLRPDDEAALFTFDRALKAVVPFSGGLPALRQGLDRIEPFGSTSLYDAVAASARQLGDRRASRRAVIAITDGFDTSSDLSAAVASSIAGAIDVPVYVLAVAAATGPADARAVALEPVEGGGVARLDDLTARTGGVSFSAEGPLETGLAVKQIVADLRAAYMLAFAPDPAPGWHQIVVRVARKNARVRTRAGFWMTAPAPSPAGRYIQ
jgi:Ca-activated chloride channel family protein